MKKGLLFLAVVFCSVSLHAQHYVNDVAQYGGWFKVRFDIRQNGKASYFITQCYPSGDEYEVKGPERDKLPLFFKALCMGVVEEAIGGVFDIEDWSFEEDGISIKMTDFSFAIIFKFSKSEEEIVEMMGEDFVNEYKNRKWD